VCMSLPTGNDFGLMKTFSLILLLGLVGCNRSGKEAILAQSSEQVRQWVPMGSPLAVARQTMEEHQYKCSVTSFNSVEEMQRVLPNDIGIWKEMVIRDRVIHDITNVTYLECKREPLVVLLRLVNGETTGIFSVQQ
jgi:hypothetical protein